MIVGDDVDLRRTQMAEIRAVLVNYENLCRQEEAKKVNSAQSS